MSSDIPVFVASSVCQKIFNKNTYVAKKLGPRFLMRTAINHRGVEGRVFRAVCGVCVSGVWLCLVRDTFSVTSMVKSKSRLPMMVFHIFL